MKNKYIVSLALTGLCAFAIIWGLQFGPSHPKYLPITYEDGTKEFRLINAGPDREDGTPDDQHWVLRMPAGIWTRSLDEGRTERQIRDNPDYPYNQNFKFTVQLPNFSFIENPFEGVRTDLLEVLVGATQVQYGVGALDRFGTASFSNRFELLADLNCRKDVEVGPGVFFLRQPNIIETQEMTQRYGETVDADITRRFLPPECSWDAKFGRPEQEIAVYGLSGEPIGYGDCRLQSFETKLKPSDFCNVKFWFSIEREVLVSFGAEYVPLLQEIHGQVTALLQEATDYKKSVNIMDWESIK